MPKYTCPKCGKVGYLVMSEVKDFRSGTFYYRFRMIHPGKGTRKECLLIQVPPSHFAKAKRKAQKQKRARLSKARA